MSDVAVQLLVGVLTVVAAFYAARSGARATQASTDALDRAARREEWFRRVQWAAGLTLASGTRSQADGLALLTVLARSDLADDDDEHLIEALNQNEVLDGLHRRLTSRGEAVHVRVSVDPAAPAAAAAAHAEPTAGSTSAPTTITVSPTVVEAARLRIVLDERLNRTTTTVTRTLAGAPAP